MRKYIVVLALMIASLSINAQTEETIPVVNKTSEDMQEDLQQVLKPTYGDYYEGLSKKITFDRMIPPYGLEVTFDKTVHIIFPAPIQYVDLGSNRIIAGKAGTSENILRVKASIKDFEAETNMAVITQDGSYYTFNVKYASEPEKLNIEMKDFMHDGIAANRPNNSMDIYLKELGSESPRIVYLVNRAIYNTDKRLVKHIGSKRFGIQYLLKGIYSHNNLLYLHTSIKNSSNVPFDIDFVRMKIVDKKMVKQTAIQETVIYPLRAYNFISSVGGNQVERTVFTIDKVTIPNDKQLVIELFEKNGGRNQSFVIENEDLLRAEEINELKVK
ncbi:conjugative transposon protein TraN [Dysgonomonas macrotermitis]|uniref:Bacteroides conjugative transposon TraN protein n=1 Tax=Dysgonomonas macrotermitis TaxID=1346286 RepID=A0A1M5J7A2_9BACT|nr:conjugative transposon protein TraN [Dysgonomonas macrotermitis]SHG36422.1 Bacteroides conjugative transposon TraN protein [Dysgonomonas macrotermitis]